MTTRERPASRRTGLLAAVAVAALLAAVGGVPLLGWVLGTGEGRSTLTDSLWIAQVAFVAIAGVAVVLAVRAGVLNSRG